MRNIRIALAMATVWNAMCAPAFAQRRSVTRDECEGARAQVARSVVFVRAINEVPLSSWGTGVLVAPGDGAFTALHVLSGAQSVRIYASNCLSEEDQARLEGTVGTIEWIDRSRDLAFIRLAGLHVDQIATAAQHSVLQAGTQSLLAGWASGERARAVGTVQLTGLFDSVHDGIFLDQIGCSRGGTRTQQDHACEVNLFDSTARPFQALYLRTEAISGQSGTPLFNSENEFIGLITTQLLSGAAAAVPIEDAIHDDSSSCSTSRGCPPPLVSGAVAGTRLAASSETHSHAYEAISLEEACPGIVDMMQSAAGLERLCRTFESEAIADAPPNFSWSTESARWSQLLTGDASRVASSCTVNSRAIADELVIIGDLRRHLGSLWTLWWMIRDSLVQPRAGTTSWGRIGPVITNPLETQLTQSLGARVATRTVGSTDSCGVLRALGVAQVLAPDVDCDDQYRTQWNAVVESVGPDTRWIELARSATSQVRLWRTALDVGILDPRQTFARSAEVDIAVADEIASRLVDAPEAMRRALAFATSFRAVDNGALARALRSVELQLRTLPAELLSPTSTNALLTAFVNDALVGTALSGAAGASAVDDLFLGPIEALREAYDAAIVAWLANADSAVRQDR